MVSHANVTHFVDVMVERYQITERDRFSQNFDMTFQRQIKLGTRMSANLRWDIFNVFNTVTFGFPN